MASCLLRTQQWEPQGFSGLIVSFGNRARQCPNPEYVTLPFGDGDGLVRIQQVKRVRRLQQLFVRRDRQSQIDQTLAFSLTGFKPCE